MSENYSKKELRRFALVFTLALGIFSIRFCKSGNVFLGGLFLVSAFVAFLIGLFQPSFIAPIYKLLKSLVLVLR